jgi:hypothetical protein
VATPPTQANIAVGKQTDGGKGVIN